MALPIEVQIKVLKSIDWDNLQKEKLGLCYAIRKSIINNGMLSCSDRISLYIPLFTYENARRYADAHYCFNTTGYWWKISGYSEMDYLTAFSNRKRFINWIVEQLENIIKNEE